MAMLCVRVTDCHYIFNFGNEPGVEIGLIRYPKYPGDNIDIHALSLAEVLMD